MKVNPEIKKTLSEISSESVKLANNPTVHYRYVRRILRVYEQHLKEEDKVYLMNIMLEMLHYRTAMLDPENMMQAANIRIRTILFVAMMVILVIIVAGIVLKTNDSLNGIVDYFLTISKAISLTKGD